MTALCYSNFKHPILTRSLVFLLCVLFNSIFSTKPFLITLLVCHTASHLEGTHAKYLLPATLTKENAPVHSAHSIQFFLHFRLVLHNKHSVLFFVSYLQALYPNLPYCQRLSDFLLYTQKSQDRARHPKEISHPSIFRVHNGHQPRQRRTRRMKSVRGAEADVLTRFLSLTSWALNFSHCSSFAWKVFYLDGAARSELRNSLESLP